MQGGRKKEVLITTIKKDIWQIHQKIMKSAIVIPTNGSVNVGNHAVMGKGLAADVRKRFPSFARELGYYLLDGPNVVQYFPEYHIITFPTKHEWYQPADMNLIRQSCRQLVELIENNNLQQVYLPRVGCGNGKLRWEQVRPLLEEEFDDVKDRIIFVEHNHATK